MYVIDCEVYSNYFLLAAMHLDTEKVYFFEKYEGKALSVKNVLTLMRTQTTISFNGINYDLPVIAFALRQTSGNDAIKALSDSIIKSNLPAYKIAKQFGINVPDAWDHIDLIEVAPGRSSLKIYGARMNAPTIQDLPIEPDASIDEIQREQLRQYCVNDLKTTAMLYRKLQKQIELRASMGKQYGVELRSKSDAQIAEEVLKVELKKMTGNDYRKPDVPDGQTFRYLDPKIINFYTPQLTDTFERLLKTKFALGANGSLTLPDWMKDLKINIGSTVYTMGIGGLHSCEKSQTVIACEGMAICDMDVASYYPSIILQQRLAPKSLGEPFLKVYQSIVERRLEAKAKKDTVTADTLKITINGSFGKLGSKYSFLYAPDLLIQTTITGQLAILMLIERMEAAGVRVVSANTDGIVLYYKRGDEKRVESVAFHWMLDTGFELEKTEYRALASRDVNNYVAVKPDGSIKGKGCFAGTGLMKNPDNQIIYEAVAKAVAIDADLGQTIRDCTDITKFVSVRRVDGGGQWQGQYLGKAVRFYQSSTVPKSVAIEYVRNGNRVPKSSGARPLMSLPDTFPDDVDYDWYIVEAERLLCEVGYV